MRRRGAALLIDKERRRMQALSIGFIKNTPGSGSWISCRNRAVSSEMVFRKPENLENRVGFAAFYAFFARKSVAGSVFLRL
jgi:hypothetical protein